ncbi:phosphate transport system substrate-binding protein [Aquisalibacillus elongatus]|uniref:Phosphate transport system substrate-binding protein n=2 Tax=Aquisalibacillus elongatus TaxID=485577 RepID=A0A3N5B4J1_9BACI|nr:phosphate transport system substrate-binding protein [Aquisalibacillus elongatus]
MEKYMWLGSKVLVTIILTIGIIFTSLLAIIYTSMTVSTGRTLVYVLIILLALGIVVFWILGVFNILHTKKLVISMGIYFGMCLLVFVGYQWYVNYLDSLEVVSTQDVDLRAYQPFTEGNELVTFDEESTIDLENELPVLDGATALYPVYAAFAQAVYPEKDYPFYEGEVMVTQTPRAYENLLNDRADLIFVAGPSHQQKQAFETNGKELNMTPIGKEAFVFFVNVDNPVDELTVEEVQGIYSGEITNWKDVGGQDEAIKAFQRPENSGSQTTLEKIMDGVQLMEPPKDDVVSGMGGIIEETSDYRNHRNSIGFSFRYFANEMVEQGEIKFLEINGVYPDKASVQEGTYLFTDHFYAVSTESSHDNVAEFKDWILSNQGQELIEETGYVPVK